MHTQMLNCTSSFPLSPASLVSMSPRLLQIFTGDIFYLNCDNNTGGSRVKWYIDDNEQTQTNKTWKIAVAAPKHSGSYKCESNGLKSDAFPIVVLGKCTT